MTLFNGSHIKSSTEGGRIPSSAFVVGRSGHSCMFGANSANPPILAQLPNFPPQFDSVLCGIPHLTTSLIIFCEDYSVLRVLFPFSLAGSNGIDFILVSIWTAIAS